MMEPAHLFNFRRFEFVHAPFELPENIYLFRSVDPSIVVNPTEPLFFGDHEVANIYRQNRVLKAYRPTRRLRVIDMRYIQAVLPKLLEDMNYMTQEDERCLIYLTLSLGLCSLRRQARLLREVQAYFSEPELLRPMIERMDAFLSLPLKPSWVNPIEEQGVRCGIRDIDYMVAGFLKEFIGDLVDGVIAPEIPSPLHADTIRNVGTAVMHQEIILFNPQETLTEVITDASTLDVRAPAINASAYLALQMRVATTRGQLRTISLISSRRFQQGGSMEAPTPRDSFAEDIARGNKKKAKAYKEFLRQSSGLVKRLRKSNRFFLLCIHLSQSKMEHPPL